MIHQICVLNFSTYFVRKYKYFVCQGLILTIGFGTYSMIYNCANQFWCVKAYGFLESQRGHLRENLKGSTINSEEDLDPGVGAKDKW